MSLINKAISEEEARERGGVAISFPCRNVDELWIIKRMIADLESAGEEWGVVKTVHKTDSKRGSFETPALELWKLN